MKRVYALLDLLSRRRQHSQRPNSIRLDDHNCRSICRRRSGRHHGAAVCRQDQRRYRPAGDRGKSRWRRSHDWHWFGGDGRA